MSGEAAKGREEKPGRALEIKLHLPVAQFRNPLTFYHAQSYPLPPRSTVIGMLQNQLERFGALEGAEVSIKGTYGEVVFNYVRKVKGKILLSEKGLLNVQTLKGKRKVVVPLLVSQRDPVLQQELFDVDLLIHISAEEGLLTDLMEALSSPRKAIYLGRGEDVAFVEDIRIVQPKKGSKRLVKLELGAYIPAGVLAGTEGLTSYLMLEVDRLSSRSYSVFVRRGEAPLKVSTRVLYYAPPETVVELLDGASVEFDDHGNPLFWIGPQK